MATMIIEGQRVQAASGETYDVVNPATGEVVDKVPAGGPEDVDRAAKAAAKAQEGWGRLAPAERAKILHKAAAHAHTKVEEIAPILTREQG
ncbi:MAG TPA: aldehyde dehydrogenase family protein, partial [Candidatus Dormibacteraeota bacterium]